MANNLAISAQVRGRPGVVLALRNNLSCWLIRLPDWAGLRSPRHHRVSGDPEHHRNHRQHPV